MFRECVNHVNFILNYINFPGTAGCNFTWIFKL